MLQASVRRPQKLNATALASVDIAVGQGANTVLVAKNHQQKELVGGLSLPALRTT